MKTLVCYKSKYGATEKYAKMLAAETSADLIEFGEAKKDCFTDYDTIVISSGTYMGLMPLTKFLKKYWKRLQEKKVVVVAVGAAPADDNWSDFSYKRIPEKIRDRIKYYKIMGEDPEPARKEGYITKVKKENLKEIINFLNS